MIEHPHVRGGDGNIIKYKHENGFNVLVAAAKLGSREIFEVLALEAPELLNESVWDGMSWLMVACQYLSKEVVTFLLDEKFYESRCRGHMLDANTISKKQSNSSLVCRELWVCH